MSDNNVPPEPNGSGNRPGWLRRFNLSIGALIGIFLVCTVTAGYLLTTDSKGGFLGDYIFPLLAVLCVLDVLAVLGILAQAFCSMGLANRDQALGLPEGSIRAVVAITLLVLFGGISVFLYQHASQNQDTHKHLTTAEKEALVKGLAAEKFVAFREVEEPATQTNGATTTGGGGTTAGAGSSPVTGGTGGTSTTSGTASSAGAGGTPSSGAGNPAPDKKATTPNTSTTGTEPKWTVVLFGESPGSSDLAKQILTTLGTLLTALVGFYFGAGVTQSAAAKGAQQALTAQNRTIV